MNLMNGLLYGATVVWWVFIVWYGVRAKWWLKAYGRNTFGTSLGLAMTLAGLSSLQLVGWQDWNIFFWCATLSLLLVGGINRLYHLERVQSEHNRDN